MPYLSGYGRGLDIEHISAPESWVQNGLQPDLTLLLDLAPEVAEQRMQERTKDRMESEQREFYQRVRPVTLSVLRKCMFSPMQNKVQTVLLHRSRPMSLTLFDVGEATLHV